MEYLNLTTTKVSPAVKLASVQVVQLSFNICYDYTTGTNNDQPAATHVWL